MSLATRPARQLSVRRRSAASLAVLALALGAGVLAGCAETPKAAASSGPPCPTDPIKVVASVDQWGEITDELAGQCGDLTIVLASSAIDPHDYEPSPADANAFTAAQVVVINGADYDHWAEDVLKTLDTSPIVVDGGQVVGAADGANPHLWYSPTYVKQIAAAITEALTKASPDAGAYFADRATAWEASMGDYDSLVDALSKGAAGKTYGATESVFDYMAEAIGLVDGTPAGYAQSAANESEPAPGDILAFQEALGHGKIDVLVYNTQTEGSAPQQILDAAESGSVPVLDVTETITPDGATFADWQTKQLKDLAEALRVDY